MLIGSDCFPASICKLSWTGIQNLQNSMAIFAEVLPISPNFPVISPAGSPFSGTTIIILFNNNYAERVRERKQKNLSEISVPATEKFNKIA
jgi:hypothetical protein